MRDHCDLHLCVSRWINEADRGPRLATQPENRPRRNQVAPVCHLYSAHCSRRRPPTIVAYSSYRSADDVCMEVRPRLELRGARRSLDRRPPHAPATTTPRHPRATRARRTLREGTAPNPQGVAQPRRSFRARSDPPRNDRGRRQTLSISRNTGRLDAPTFFMSNPDVAGDLESGSVCERRDSERHRLAARCVPEHGRPTGVAVATACLML